MSKGVCNPAGETKLKYMGQLSAELYGADYINNKKLGWKSTLYRIVEASLYRRQKFLGGQKNGEKFSIGKGKELEIRVEYMRGSELLRNSLGEYLEIKLLSDDEWPGKPSRRIYNYCQS